MTGWILAFCLTILVLSGIMGWLFLLAMFPLWTFGITVVMGLTWAFKVLFFE